MPKVDDFLLALATLKTVGGMSYRGQRLGGDYVRKWKQVRQLSGITKGQWKRLQVAIKRTGNNDLRTSLVSIKKLEVMRDHHDSPHLLTLLKMVEVQMETSDEQ